ncbi:uncharacterized protein GJ701_006075 isoform 1-T1 [Geothlypis trichas]
MMDLRATNKGAEPAAGTPALFNLFVPSLLSSGRGYFAGSRWKDHCPADNGAVCRAGASERRAGRLSQRHSRPVAIAAGRAACPARPPGLCEHSTKAKSSYFFSCSLIQAGRRGEACKLDLGANILVSSQRNFIITQSMRIPLFAFMAKYMPFHCLGGAFNFTTD